MDKTKKVNIIKICILSIVFGFVNTELSFTFYNLFKLLLNTSIACGIIILISLGVDCLIDKDGDK